jgi:hypothetical protein
MDCVVKGGGWSYVKGFLQKLQEAQTTGQLLMDSMHLSFLPSMVRLSAFNCLTVSVDEKHLALQVLSCRCCSFLSLLSNNITKLPDNFGIYFPNLKYLDISFNPIVLLPSSLTLCPLDTVKGCPALTCRCNFYIDCFEGQGTALVGPSADLVALGHVSFILKDSSTAVTERSQVPSLFRYLTDIQKGMARGIIRFDHWPRSSLLVVHL